MLNINLIKSNYFSKITGYNPKTINVFLEEEIFEDIKTYNYSKTLDNITNTEYFEKEYINEYINIKYVEQEDFLKNISLLLDKGYKHEEINNIYNSLSITSINILIQNNYLKDITNVISLNYFKEENIERYISYYKKENNKDIETIVTYVNIGLDNEYYTNIIKVDNQDDLLVLVNKYNQLSSDYTPENLQEVSYGTGKLKKEAAIAFDKMCAAAKKENILIYGGSGYRSYSYQLELYNRYVTQDGIQKADTYSARAGHSEHQTGLAMDILNKNWGFIEETSKEYTWLVNNSYKYGFILRYLKGKENITGYKFEPWHYRYVGIDVATEIHNLNITYDEYIAKK